MLASTYVARYGADALPLARMAHTDAVERKRRARADLYAGAIRLLVLRAREQEDVHAASTDVRMTINHENSGKASNSLETVQGSIVRTQYFSYA